MILLLTDPKAYDIITITKPVFSLLSAFLRAHSELDIQEGFRHEGLDQEVPKKA